MPPAAGPRAVYLRAFTRSSRLPARVAGQGTEETRTKNLESPLKGCARGIGVWRVAEAVERAVTGRDPADLVDPLERLARAINETRVIAELLAAA